MVLSYKANGKKEIPNPADPTDYTLGSPDSAIESPRLQIGTLGIGRTEIGSTSSGTSAPPSRSVSTAGSATGLVV